MGVGNYPNIQCPLFRKQGLAASYSYKMDGDLQIDTYQVSENDRGVEISFYPRNLTKGARQAGLYLFMDRTSDYTMTSTDGNPDLAMKIYARSTDGSSSTTNVRVRGLDISCRVRSSSQVSFLNALYATCEVDSGCVANDFYVAQFNLKLSGTATGPLYGIVIQDQSQGATAISNTSMIYCHTAYSRGGAREAVLKVEHASGDTYGYTSVIECNVPATNLILVGASGDGGVTVGSDGMDGDPEGDQEAGYITIVVGSTSYQVPFYATS